MYDAPCVICGHADSEDGNQIVLCDGCDVAVHQECYGIEHVPAADWYCEPCAAARAGKPRGQKAAPSMARCGVCPVGGGALKRTLNGQWGGWAHAACVLWTNGPGFADETKMKDAAGFQTVYKELSPNGKLGCVLCTTPEDKRAGYRVQCGFKNCCKAMHASCAVSHGWYVDRYEHAVPYCAQHSKVMRARAREEAELEESLDQESEASTSSAARGKEAKRRRK